MAGTGKSSHRAADRGSEETRSSEPPRYLAVARILRPWGVQGMVKIEILTDFPERFTAPGEFFVGEDHRPLQLERSQAHKGTLLLKFAGYDTPEACDALRDKILYIPIEQAMPLAQGKYYVHQIIGLTVWTDEGEQLGTLTEIWETGANDVYVVERDGKLFLLPAISEVVLDIDLDQKRMTVHLLDGLIP